MKLTDTSNSSSYYDADYFNWQKNIGAFGGKANSFKFVNSIKPHDTVLDFGCGGGFLLSNIDCKRKIGIEPNIATKETLQKFDIEHFENSLQCIELLGSSSVDVIISNHALEHTLNPLEEIKTLHTLLKEGGIAHFFIPLDSIKYAYNPDDINYHLFSWSPQNLGNLFKEAGFQVLHVGPYHHKWPPHFEKIAKLGWPIFHLACRIYARIERKWFQVELIAKK